MSETNEGQLGNVVAWRVPATVTVAQLRAALIAAGLPEEYAGDMLPRNALARALRDLNANRVIRKLDQRGEDLIFQINRVATAGDHVEYPHETDVRLHLPTGMVTSDDSEIETEARQLLAEHTGKRLTSDLTRLVQEIFNKRKADLIPIREQGGAYFVPDSASDLVDSVRVLLREIGGSLRSFAVRLGSGDTSASVAESMAEYLTGLLAEFKASCEDVTHDSRKDVRERRTEAVGELRQKLENYRGLLMGFGATIGTEIDAAEQALLAKLMAPPEPDLFAEQLEANSDIAETVPA